MDGFEFLVRCVGFLFTILAAPWSFYVRLTSDFYKMDLWDSHHDSGSPFLYLFLSPIRLILTLLHPLIMFWNITLLVIVYRSYGYNNAGFITLTILTTLGVFFGMCSWHPMYSTAYISDSDGERYFVSVGYSILDIITIPVFLVTCCLFIRLTKLIVNVFNRTDDLSGRSWIYINFLMSFVDWFSLVNCLLSPFFIWRFPSLLENLSNKEKSLHSIDNQLEKRKIIFLHVVQGIIDLPFIAMGLCSLCLFWRIKFFLTDFFNKPNDEGATWLRTIAFNHFIGGLLDIPTFFFLIFITIFLFHLKELKEHLSESKQRYKEARLNHDTSEGFYHGIVFLLFLKTILHSPFIIIGFVCFISWRHQVYKKDFLKSENDKERILRTLKHFGLLIFLDLFFMIIFIFLFITRTRWDSLHERIFINKPNFNSAWPHYHVMVEFGYFIIDIPFFILWLFTLISFWRKNKKNIKEFDSPKERRIYIAKQSGLLILDIPCLVFFVILLPTWRHFCIRERLFNKERTGDWHEIIIDEFYRLILDIPFIAMGLLSLWRLKILIDRCFFENIENAFKRRKLAAWHFFWTFLDILLLIPIIIQLITLWRIFRIYKIFIEEIYKNPEKRYHKSMCLSFLNWFIDIPFVLCFLITFFSWRIRILIINLKSVETDMEYRMVIFKEFCDLIFLDYFCLFLLILCFLIRFRTLKYVYKKIRKEIKGNDVDSIHKRHSLYRKLISKCFFLSLIDLFWIILVILKLCLLFRNIEFLKRLKNSLNYKGKSRPKFIAKLTDFETSKFSNFNCNINFEKIFSDFDTESDSSSNSSNGGSSSNDETSTTNSSTSSTKSVNTSSSTISERGIVNQTGQIKGGYEEDGVSTSSGEMESPESPEFQPINQPIENQSADLLNILSLEELERRIKVFSYDLWERPRFLFHENIFIETQLQRYLKLFGFSNETIQLMIKTKTPEEFSEYFLKEKYLFNQNDKVEYLGYNLDLSPKLLLPIFIENGAPTETIQKYFGNIMVRIINSNSESTARFSDMMLIQWITGDPLIFTDVSYWNPESIQIGKRNCLNFSEGRPLFRWKNYYQTLLVWRTDKAIKLLKFLSNLTEENLQEEYFHQDLLENLNYYCFEIINRQQSRNPTLYFNEIFNINKTDYTNVLLDSFIEILELSYDKGDDRDKLAYEALWSILTINCDLLNSRIYNDLKSGTRGYSGGVIYNEERINNQQVDEPDLFNNYQQVDDEVYMNAIDNFTQVVPDSKELNNSINEIFNIYNSNNYIERINGIFLLKYNQKLTRKGFHRYCKRKEFINYFMELFGFNNETFKRFSSEERNELSQTLIDESKISLENNLLNKSVELLSKALFLQRPKEALFNKILKKRINLLILMGYCKDAEYDLLLLKKNNDNYPIGWVKMLYVKREYYQALKYCKKLSSSDSESNSKLILKIKKKFNNYVLNNDVYYGNQSMDDLDFGLKAPKTMIFYSFIIFKELLYSLFFWFHFFTIPLKLLGLLSIPLKKYLFLRYGKPFTISKYPWNKILCSPLKTEKEGYYNLPYNLLHSTKVDYPNLTLFPLIIIPLFLIDLIGFIGVIFGVIGSLVGIVFTLFSPLWKKKWSKSKNNTTLGKFWIQIIIFLSAIGGIGVLGSIGGSIYGVYYYSNKSIALVIILSILGVFSLGQIKHTIRIIVPVFRGWTSIIWVYSWFIEIGFNSISGYGLIGQLYDKIFSILFYSFRKVFGDCLGGLINFGIYLVYLGWPFALTIYLGSNKNSKYYYLFFATIPFMIAYIIKGFKLIIENEIYEIKKPQGKLIQLQEFILKQLVFGKYHHIHQNLKTINLTLTNDIIIKHDKLSFNCIFLYPNICEFLGTFNYKEVFIIFITFDDDINQLPDSTLDRYEVLKRDDKFSTFSQSNSLSNNWIKK